MNLLMTLGELLADEKPSIELLQLVKKFAKLCKRNPENPLPSEIVMFLYYTSITVALLRLNEPISELTDTSLIRGVNWLHVQPWMPEEMRSLLQEGLSYLRSRGSNEANEIGQ